MLGTILYFVIVLAIVGLVLWLINSLIPMDPRIKQIIQVVVVVLLAIWLLYILLGLTGSGGIALAGPHPCALS